MKLSSKSTIRAAMLLSSFLALGGAYAQQPNSALPPATGTNTAVNTGTNAPTNPAKKSDAKILSRSELDALLAKPDQVVLIDVRRPDELIAIGGFPVYLSIQAKELEKNLAFIPKDRAIVTVSNHAGRAANAADLLKNKGYKVAGAVGAQNYEAEGGTLSKIAPPPPKTADASK